MNGPDHAREAGSALSTAAAASTAASTPAPENAQEKAPAFWARRKKRGNEICQLLIRAGDVKPEHVRMALRIQEERGGQIGRILVKMGACTEAAIARALTKQVRLAHDKGRGRNVSLLAREHPDILGLEVLCSPARTRATLLVTDLVVLLAAGLMAGGVERLIAGTPFFLEYGVPELLLCPIVFALLSLYSPTAPSPPDEIRRTTFAITLVFAGDLTVAIAGGRAPWHVFAMIVLEWLFVLVAVPIARAVTRARFGRSPWWGAPAVVLGAGKTGRKLVQALRARPSMGLRPVVILDDDTRKHGTLRASFTGHESEIQVDSIRDVPVHSVMALEVARLHSTRDLGSVRDVSPSTVRSPTPPAPPSNASLDAAAPGEPSWLHVVPESIRGVVRGQFSEVEGVPVVGGLDLAPVLAQRLGISYAIVAMPGQSSRHLVKLTEKVGGAFSHLLVIPDLFGLACIGVPSREVGGVLGIEVRQQLLLPWPRFVKRVMDLTLTLAGGVFLLPIVGTLTLLIKLDSKGPAFYTQKRLGRDGKRFVAYKFRSMHGDGEERLKAVLENDPKLRAEYEEFHKLSFDPRVTRIGRVLRKYSLDELPQLWNVIRGDMSLVGPRPYLEREVPEMQQQEGIILRAMPGMTGLWQVSDRNSTGFTERLRTDVHYVRNWSPWLDLYVLARTVGVVLGGTGS